MNEQKKLIHTNKFPQLAYYSFGSGPAIVLIHGFPENADLWKEIWPALSQRFTVIVPDLPGVGDSTFVPGMSMEDMAESVRTCLDAENIQQAVVVGHSMGGYTALAMADLYPGLIKGLSLVHSSAAADDEEKIQTRLKAIELIKNGGKDGFIRQMVPNLFADNYKNAHSDIVDLYVERGRNVPAEVLTSFYTAMINRPDRIPILEEAVFPVQFVMGNNDNVIPPSKVLTQARLAKVNFISLYSECGHMSMLELPLRLSSDLAEFSDYCFTNNK
jgi:pimeloyl-ACP methyl ester carboxylesterase